MLFAWCLFSVGFVWGGMRRLYFYVKLHAQFAYYKSPELGLNLSGSWHKDHSHTYNTRSESESSTKDLSFPIFVLLIRQLRLPLVRSRAQLLCHSMVWVCGPAGVCGAQRTFTRVGLFKKPQLIVTHVEHQESAVLSPNQHGFGLRGIQP